MEGGWSQNPTISANATLETNKGGNLYFDCSAFPEEPSDLSDSYEAAQGVHLRASHNSSKLL